MSAVGDARKRQAANPTLTDAEREALRVVTDTDPLAPIEALADNWARGYPSLVIAPQLRAALAGARQAVDALVTERAAALTEHLTESSDGFTDEEASDG